MKLHRITLVAGLVAAGLAVAGCEQAADGPLAPSPRASAPTAPAPGPLPPGSTLGAVDDATWLGGGTPSPTWYDTEGHAYSVSIADDGGARHFRDGQLFATSAAVAGGTSVTYYQDGAILQQDFIVAGGAPMTARSLNEDRAAPPERQGRPQRAMVVPCADQISNYVIASGLMVAAGVIYSRNPTNAKARSAFMVSMVNFASAWRELYQCQKRLNE